MKYNAEVSESFKVIMNIAVHYHQVFQGKRKLLKNPEWQKIFQYSEKFQSKLCFQGKRKLLKILNTKSTFNIVKNFRETVFQGKRKLLKNRERWKIFNTVYIHLGWSV